MNSTVSSLSSIYTLRPCCLFVWHFSSHKPAFPHDAMSRKTRNQTVPRWNAVLFTLAAATQISPLKEKEVTVADQLKILLLFDWYKNTSHTGTVVFFISQV